MYIEVRTYTLNQMRTHIKCDDNTYNILNWSGHVKVICDAYLNYNKTYQN